MADSALDSSKSGHSPVSGSDKPRNEQNRYVYWTLVVLIVSAGVWLRSPVLAGARISDDWDHYAMVEGIYPTQRTAFDLYDFINAAPSDRASLLRSGRLPWWSDPDIRISFFRPLASISIYADYAWLGAGAAPSRAHLHSLLWWAASLLAVAGVLRSVFEADVALVALLLFTVDEGHALPVAWSASRAEIIATTLMMCGFWSFIAWSKSGQVRAGALSFFLTVLALLAGEHALSLFPYVAGFALFGAGGTVSARCFRLSIASLPVVGFLVIHVIGHYGVAGSSFYSDPFGDLPGFLSAFPQRAAWLLGDAMWGYSADWSFTPPAWVWWLQARGAPSYWLTHESLLLVQTVLGGLAAGVVVSMWIWAERAKTDHDAAQVRWLLIGAVAALVPLSSAFAMTRLTVAPGLGILSSLAVLATRACKELRSRRRLRNVALVAAVALLHGAVAASRSYAASVLYATWSSGEEAWVRDADFGVSSVATRRIFVISAHDTASQYALPFFLHLMGSNVPESSQILLPPALHPIEIRRSAANALDITAVDPNGHFGFLNSAYRRAEATFYDGQHLSNPHFRIEVVNAVKGIPRSLRFVFARSVEDAEYVFMYPTEQGLRPLALPGVGASRLLPPPALPRVDSNEVGR